MKEVRRWGWGWLVLPSILIFGLLLVPRVDEFAEFAQGERPVLPGETLAFPDGASGLIVEGLSPRRGNKVRGWNLSDRFSDYPTKIRQLGFTQVAGSGVTPYRLDGGQTIYARWFAYEDSQTDARAVVLEGSTLPRGTECVLFVEEPMGIRAAWRRWVARSRGLPKP